MDMLFQIFAAFLLLGWLSIIVFGKAETVYTALKSGKINANMTLVLSDSSTFYSREANPVRYWFVVIFWSAFVVMGAGTVIVIGGSFILHKLS